MLDRNAEDPSLPRADPVSELLMGMRLSGASYGRMRLSPPFGVGFPDEGEARFHFVSGGRALLRAAGAADLALACGDAILLPRGDAHVLVSGPGVPVRPVASLPSEPLCGDVCAIEARCAGPAPPGADALIFTGRMRFELDTMHPLVALMPRVMSVGALLERQPEIRPLLDAMEREMAAERAGAAGILARLADVVAATIVRGWVEGGCGDASGWLGALRDRRLGTVLAALHREPGREWTVPEMAALMGSSRSVFAERFAAATGTTPQRYLAALRMRLAEQWLARDRLTVEAVAARLGYGSQAAFSRAYKRVTGHAPGSARRPTG